VLPALNERRYIRDCLDSLARQDYQDLVEILVVDGGSTDGTAAIAAAVDPRVRVVENPSVTAASGMNVGIAEATGDVVCRADAHTIYAADYVSRCVGALLEAGAVNAGGPMRAVGTTNFGRAVAAVTSSAFAVGPGRFHLSERREDDVDTVYLGTFPRDVLRHVGGYDDRTLQWAAEDHELNFRLRQDGGRIVLDPSIVSWYFPRDTPRALMRQYHNYGMGKASTLAKHRRLPTWRPLAPAALVLGVLVLIVTARWRAALALLALHAGFCAAGAKAVSDDPGVAPHRAFAAVEICHWSYGLGVWRGFGRWASGRGFTSRPHGHR
jgi:glycosyltransferase involved in cell wall biosynthesis